MPPEAVPTIDPNAAGANGADLLELAAELVAIPSVSRNEAAIAQLVETRLSACQHLQVERIGDSVIARTTFGHKTRLLLAGHLDTVPPSDTPEKPAGIEGEALYGLGAVDMKGALAVFLDLAETAIDIARDVTYVFYACEEIARSENALNHIAETRPELLQADSAILGEPTAGFIEAGCQGTMRVEITLVGKRAHTARPWQGLNAIHRLGEVLQPLSEYVPRQVDLNGCTYTEQIQAVGVSGGVAGNVVPDVATLVINYRFAPDRNAQDAEAALREIIGPGLDEKAGDQLKIIDVAEGAPPGIDHPLMAKIIAIAGTKPRAKVGWTDVATLWAAGIPSANFGPGDPLLAHTANEVVTRVELEEARQVLWRILAED